MGRPGHGITDSAVETQTQAVISQAEAMGIMYNPHYLDMLRAGGPA
jgi:hypothetical protein